jgi:hypothetical protein
VNYFARRVGLVLATITVVLLFVGSHARGHQVEQSMELQGWSAPFPVGPSVQNSYVEPSTSRLGGLSYTYDETTDRVKTKRAECCNFTGLRGRGPGSPSNLAWVLDYDAGQLLLVSRSVNATKSAPCGPGNSFTPETRVLMADGTTKPTSLLATWC